MKIEKEEKKEKNIYKEFTKKAAALKYLEKIKTPCSVYGFDVSAVTPIKKFVVSNPTTILNKISEGKNFFYENIEKGQEVAFGLDLDIKCIDENETNDNVNKYIAVVIDKVKTFFKKKFSIILNPENFLITKSPYCHKKLKHSFHIKVVGYKFPCPYAVKHYFLQMGFIEKIHGTDDSVYRAGLIRTTFSSKRGQQRALLPYEIEKGNIFIENCSVEESLGYFKESMWCYVKGYEMLDCGEYIEKLEEKQNKIKEKQNKIEKQKILFKEKNEEFDPTTFVNCAYDIGALEDLLSLIDCKRFNEEGDWKKLLWILKNQDFDCFKLFDRISSFAEKYEGTEKTKETWDKHQQGKYNYSIGTLKYWAKTDSPSEFQSVVGNVEKFNIQNIKKIILSCCRGNENIMNLVVNDKEELIFKIIDYFNKFFVKVKDLKGKVIFIEQRGKESIMRDRQDFLNFLEDAGLRFSYEVVTKNGINIVKYPRAADNDIGNAGRLWLASPYKTAVQNITFYPDENKKFEDIYNLFKGLPITAEIAENATDDNNIEPLKKHIFNIWCKKDEKIFEYTYKLLAFYLQNKHIKSGVALVISGDKGTGKSCIIEKFLEIFGKYGKIVNKLDSVIGTFNSMLKDVLMVYVNEATFTGNKEETNKLRNLITTPEVYVNEKYMPQYTMPNFSNFIIDGNSDCLVSNHGQERRYFILETDNEWRGVDTKKKKEYFKDILNTSPIAFAKWLFSIDLTDFNIREIPETEKTTSTRVNSFEGCEEFFYNLIDDNTHSCFEKYCTMDDLYFDYCEYNKNKYSISRNKFTKECKRLMDIEFYKRKRINGEKNWVVKMSSIPKCKIKFETIFGTISWSENNDDTNTDNECLF